MSLYVVEGAGDPWAWWPVGRQTFLGVIAREIFAPRLELRDANARDGEWPAVISLPHETVEFELEGRLLAVPVFEGDVERIEWERRRCADRGQ